jgi:hypothetical protein
MAFVAPTGAGGEYRLDSIMGSHAAACCETFRKVSASFFENLAISAAERALSR